jgi:hypothetical protein
MQGCFTVKTGHVTLISVQAFPRPEPVFFFSKGIVLPDNPYQVSAYRIGVIKGDIVVKYLRTHIPDVAVTEYVD